MRRSLLFSAALAVPGALLAQQQATQPNIIMFLVDDMGWQETSVPFYKERTPLNDRYRTPNMEKMAEMGVKFTQAYACAISSPSRCSLMSGMNAARHRVTNWTLNYDNQTDAGGGDLNLPSWNWNGIQPAATANDHDKKNSALITPLPEILRQNGYHTIHCGKAHFGAISTTSEDPLSMGFDVNIAGGANGGPGSYLCENEYGSGAFHVKGLEKYYGTGTFLTEALTLEAIEAMKKPIAENKPFYLYMSHYAIHSPYNPDRRFTENYQNVGDPMLHVNLNDDEINHAALVEGMDKSLGDIMNFLQQQPKEVQENTILIFMSDNGGQSQGPRQGRWNRDQNYPARAGKGSSYEGGVHEPMMVYWPGVTEGGTINENRVMIEDFFPSILEMAGVTEYETEQVVDGKSFVDVLKDTTIQRDRVTIWHYPNRWGETQDKNEGYGAYSAIMKGDYHLIYFWETQERRLYNVREDIGEQNNLYSAMPELVKDLSQELTDSLIAFEAQRPTYKNSGEIVPWPNKAMFVAPVTETEVIKPSTSTSNPEHVYRINRGNGTWMSGTTTPGGSGLNVGIFAFFAEEGAEHEHHYKVFSVSEGKWVSYNKLSSYSDGKNKVVWENEADKEKVNAWYADYVDGAGNLGHAYSFHAIKKDGTKAGVAWNWFQGDGGNTSIGFWAGGSAATDATSAWLISEAEAPETSTDVEKWKKENGKTIGFIGGFPEDSRQEFEDVETTEQMEAFLQKYSVMGFKEGYYYIKNAGVGKSGENKPSWYLSYKYKGDDAKAMDTCVYAMDLTSEKIRFVWRFEPSKLNEAGYRLQACTHDDYMKLAEGGAATFSKFDGDKEDYFLLEDEGKAQFKVTNKDGRVMRTGGDGRINWWNNGTGNEEDERWMLQPATDLVMNINLADYAGQGYAAAYLPYDVVIPEGSSLEAYIVNSVEGNKAKMTKVNDIKGHEGVILKGSATETYTLNVGQADADFSKNLLKGSVQQSFVEGGYVLENDSKGAVLGKAELNKDAEGADGTTHFLNNEGMAYLPLSVVAAEQPTLVFDFGTSDGIHDIHGTEDDTHQMYDLGGRRLQKGQKGIYILNGHKVMR